MDEDELENWFQSTTGGGGSAKPKSPNPQFTSQSSFSATSRQTLAPPGGASTTTSARSTPTKGKFDLFADDLFNDVTTTSIPVPAPKNVRPSSSTASADSPALRPATSVGYNTAPNTTDSTSRPKTAGGSSLRKFDLNESDAENDDIGLMTDEKTPAGRPTTAAPGTPRPKSTTFDFPLDDGGQQKSSAKPRQHHSRDMFDEMFSSAAGTSPTPSTRQQPQIRARESVLPKDADELPADTDNEDATAAPPQPRQRKSDNSKSPADLRSSVRKKSPLDALFGDEEENDSKPANRPASRQRSGSKKEHQQNTAKRLSLSSIGLGRSKSSKKQADDDDAAPETEGEEANLNYDPKTKITGDPKAIEDLRQQVELTQTQIKEREKVIVGAKVDFESKLREELGKGRERQQETMDKQRQALLEFTLVEQKAASEEELKRLDELQKEMQRLHGFQLQLLKFGGSMMSSASPYAALVANPVLTGGHLPATVEETRSAANVRRSRPNLHQQASETTENDETNANNVAALTEAIVSQVTNVIPKLHSDVQNVYKAQLSALATEIKSRDDRISTLQEKLDGLEEKTLEAKESSHKFVHQVMEEHATELQHMKQLHERRLEELRTDYTAHLERIKIVYREQVESVETFVNMERAQRMQMREQMSNENKALFELKDKLLSDKEQAVEEARNEITKRQEQVNEMMTTLRELREQLVQERGRAADAAAKSDDRADQRRADYQALLSECEKERNGITSERVELLAERARWTEMFKSELTLLNTARQEFVQEKEHFKQLLIEERKRMAEERELQSEYSLAALQSNLDLSKQRAELEGIKNVTSQRLGNVEQERRQLLGLQRQLQRVKQAAQQNYTQTENAKNEQQGQLGHARHLVQVAERLIQKASATDNDYDDGDEYDGEHGEQFSGGGNAADGGDNYFPESQQKNVSRRPSPHKQQQQSQSATRLSVDSQALYNNMQNNFKMLSVRHQQLAQQRFLLHNKWQRLLKDGQSTSATDFVATDTGSLTSMTMLNALRYGGNDSAGAFMGSSNFPSSAFGKPNPIANYGKNGLQH